MKRNDSQKKNYAHQRYLKKKAKKDAKKASEAKEKERLRKEQEAREVQCSAKIRKGKGPRCKNQTENKNGKCYAHQ